MRYVDDFLGEVRQQVGEQANIVVLSDHGFGSATGHYTIRDEELATVLSGNHRHDGVLLAAGPDIRQGVFEGITTMEVAPLLLTLLDLPLSRELPGRVPEEILHTGFSERRPVRTVPSYGIEWTFVDATPADENVDERALEQLKALGYVGASTRSGRSESEGAVDFWSIDERLRKFTLQGEILYHLLRDDTEQVDRLMALVAERDPKFAESLPAVVRTGVKRLQEDFPFPVFPQGVVDLFVDTHLHENVPRRRNPG